MAQNRVEQTHSLTEKETMVLSHGSALTDGFQLYLTVQKETLLDSQDS